MRPRVLDAMDDETGIAPAANPLHELLATLWRGRRTVGLVSGLVTVAAAVGVLRSRPRFEAQASLMVRVGREYAYRPAGDRTETVRMPALSEMVHSEVEILAGRELAEQAVRTIGAGRLYPAIAELEPDPARAVERAVLPFRQATTVRPVPDSGVIKVSFQHAEPELAATAVNVLIERFEQKHVAIFGTEGLGELERRHAASLQTLAQAREALTRFRRQRGLFDLDEQRRLLLAQRAALVEQASLRLLELELEEQRLLRNYTESSRGVVSLRSEIALVRAFLRKAGQRTSAPEESRRSEGTSDEIELLVAVELQEQRGEERVQGLRLARQDQEQRCAALDDELRALEESSTTLRTLERGLAAAEAEADGLARRLLEARVDAALDREGRINVRVIEPAVAPLVPLGLSRPVRIGLGALAGLVVGVGIALLQDLLRRR